MTYTLCSKAQQLEPYDPVEGQYRVRLDANESFLLPTATDRAAMAQAAQSVAFNRYPDPLAIDLCAAFGRLYGVDPALVTAGNGSDELISVIFSTFLQKGETVLTVAPDFSMYRFYTSLTENPCLTLQKNAEMQIDVDEVIRTIHEKGVRLFIFSNPCNPTSVGLEREDVRRIIRETDALIVLDEAYMDFWEQSLLDEVADYDNLIILRTCSKMLGMAALRCGFAVANPTLTGILRAAKSPYNVNSVTQALAAIVLSNPAYIAEYRPLLLASRDMLFTGFRALEQEGLIERVYPTVTNFVFIKTDQATAIQEFLKDRGVIIRRFGEHYLRITAGTQAENKEVLDCVAFMLRQRKENHHA